MGEHQQSIHCSEDATIEKKMVMPPSLIYLEGFDILLISCEQQKLRRKEFTSSLNLDRGTKPEEKCRTSPGTMAA
ncbi:unnamed protein product [Caretta caretta]